MSKGNILLSIFCLADLHRTAKVLVFLAVLRTNRMPIMRLFEVVYIGFRSSCFVKLNYYIIIEPKIAGHITR